MAKILNCNLKTVARKITFLNSLCLLSKARWLLYDINSIQFDEMESWEHTKLKPVSIIVAVCKTSRRILDLKACSMPAKGRNATLSRKKYGKRLDHRPEALKEVISRLREHLPDDIIIESDQNPRYKKVVGSYFGLTHYTQYKGRRGCVTGQGELKAGGRDPLFCLNHTCAMIRASVNRLFRRSWNTTKKIEALQMHLNLYMDFHNRYLV